MEIIARYLSMCLTCYAHLVHYNTYSIPISAVFPHCGNLKEKPIKKTKNNKGGVEKGLSLSSLGKPRTLGLVALRSEIILMWCLTWFIYFGYIVLDSAFLHLQLSLIVDIKSNAYILAKWGPGKVQSYLG